MELGDFRVDFLAMLLPCKVKGNTKWRWRWLRRWMKILKTLLKEEGGECRTRPRALRCTRPRVKWHLLGLPSEPDKRDLTLNPSISVCLAVSCRLFFFHRSARVWCGAPRAGQSMERWRSTEKQRKLHVGSTKRWAPSDLFHSASSAQTVWLAFSSLAATHPSDTHQLLACSCFPPPTVLSPWLAFLDASLSC